MSWIDVWTTDALVFVNARHEALHYGALARAIAAHSPHADAAVLDHGCGDALSADRVAAACGKLYLCEGEAGARARIAERFASEPRIETIAPHLLEALPDHGLDLVVAHALLRRIAPDEFDELLGLWHAKLKEDGRLLLIDVVPHDHDARAETTALLRFGWSGGFLAAALAAGARSLVSGAEPREDPSRYDEEEVLALLGGRSFAGERAARNLGHDPGLMTFVARAE